MYIQPNTIHFSPKHSSTRKKARFFIIKFTPIRRIGRNPKQVHSHHEDWRATISYWCDASHQHKRNISVVDARSTRLFRSPADRHNLHVDKLGDKNQNSHQLLGVCLLKSVKYLQFAGVSPHAPKMIHLCATYDKLNLSGIVINSNITTKRSAMLSLQRKYVINLRR